TPRPKLLQLLIVLLTAAGILLIPPALGNSNRTDSGLVHAQAETPDKQQDQTKKEAEERGQETTGEGKTDRLFFKSKEGEQEVKKVTLPKQTPTISPETFRMIEMIERKNTELKKREEALTAKEQQLQTLEEKIQKDLDKIELALAKSKELLGLKEDLIKENVDALIKVYSSMKPEEAANLIAAIDSDLALQIISGMKSKIAGQVLSQLDVKVAKTISERMAGKSPSDSKK
ncbi:MAG: hypothetical protein IID18_07895, partial [Nitrospinae bacterium]|nr:hypothetical protein [Nitrospinota bacterium]